MTPDTSSDLSAKSATRPPARTPARTPAASAPTAVTDSEGRRSTGRLVGIDLARGLAVFGMYAAHVGPDPAGGGPLGLVMELARGRSSALFALLAGFTLVLITGRPHPRTGRAGRQAVVRMVIRSLVLIALGFALTALDTDVDVILAFYGLTFLAVLPLYRLRARTLALLAAAGALVLPQVLYGVRLSIENGDWAEAITAADPLARISDTDGFLELLFTGEYPVLTWASFMLAGMAVARLDLTRSTVRTQLALAGGVLTVLGYGGSWLALRLVPHARATVAAATDGDGAASAWWSDTVGYLVDGTPAAWLLVGAPHSQTTFSILGNTGVALLVVVGCVTAVDRLPRLARLAGPVCAVGMTALTAYVLHILAIREFGMAEETGPALVDLFVYLLVATVLATAWTRVFRRGPLEHVLHVCTRPARLVR
ncbi:DUF418 domain-containing protein [Streptomyces griseiscabiei]|uniref:DUF418 domain-containing protein n=1 Tax=Streptomyces griseiscabiei TaxID=2993540 RepID=A0ABU4L3G5_9ACTN|nr:DUF418 domain-containing protein [Streptomyces griseiscabiei]MBZ3901578.1 DUF418 domain-containing protein [Streptomyces griseiscabiei]MDX2909870.1 DUF418 domain-containing protein [Streptomyces griseiscabiei]